MTFCLCIMLRGKTKKNLAMDMLLTWHHPNKMRYQLQFQGPHLSLHSPNTAVRYNQNTLPCFPVPTCIPIILLFFTVIFFSYVIPKLCLRFLDKEKQNVDAHCNLYSLLSLNSFLSMGRSAAFWRGHAKIFISRSFKHIVHCDTSKCSQFGCSSKNKTNVWWIG